MSKVDLDISGILKLVGALEEVPLVKVGVLGDKDARRSEGGGKQPTNAEIGSFHEFGLGQPKRSFLRTPLIDHFEDEAIKAKETLIEQFSSAADTTDGLHDMMNTLGAIGVEVVKTAFDTQGYGKWPKWKTPNYQNNTGKILQDTQQLRESIAHEVE